MKGKGSVKAFPLAAITGHSLMELSLELGAVDTSIRGIMIAGGRGTSKAVLASDVHTLHPPPEV